MAYSSPYNYGRNALPDGQTDDETQAPGGAPTPTGPALYQPNDPSSGRQATPSGPQPTDRTAQEPVAPPRTFSQMQAEGQARPPMPEPPAPALVGNPTGMVNAQAPAQWGANDPRTQQQILSQDFGGNTNAFLSASPNAAISNQANAAQSAESQFPGRQLQYGSDGSIMDAKTGQTLKGADSGLADTMAAPFLPANQSVYQPPANQQPGPTSYLQNGLQTDAQGKAVPGGYNALNDLIGQSGSQPGVITPQMQALLKQNPQLASSLSPDVAGQYGATLSGMGYQPGQPASGVGTPSSGLGAAFTPVGATPGVPSGGVGGSGGGVLPHSNGSINGTPGNPSATDILGLLTGGATGTGAGSAVQNATQQKALDLLNNPSPYGQQDVKDLYSYLGGNIDDQYALQQKALGEDMARRGLGASTIYAGNLNDLNIGQRSAKEALAQNLATNYAQTLGQYQQGAVGTGNTVGTSAQNNQQSWLSQLMGYGQNAFNNDLATNQVNQNAQNGYQDFILKLLGLGYGGTA